MSDYEYVNEYYGVNACFGRSVTVNGEPGVIIKCMGNHIGVNFDSDKPGSYSPCHPTWRVEYHGIVKPRKPTRAQRRYQRYLEFGDCFDSFMDFVYWDMNQKE